MINLNRTLTLLEKELKFRIKHKVWLLATFIFVPLTEAIFHSLSGYYVKNVPYLSTFINYALIFATAYFIVRVYERISNGFSYRLSQININTNLILLYSQIFELLIAFGIFHIIDNTIEFVPYAIILSFLVGPIIYNILLFCILFSLILLPFTFAIALLFSTLAFKFRGRDFLGLREAIGFFFYIAIPYSYSIFILPEPFRTILYYYPPAGLLEELRKYLFLSKISFIHILFLFFESLIFLFLSYLVFERVFNLARRRGWIKLM